ncbi:MAG: hypothetical protein KatS3mg090_0620 [Patescibacteria group bacterium]|nr:MAG: hypothetical protein KatS3mg090_0620 [Patescibacteria group bacterium]
MYIKNKQLTKYISILMILLGFISLVVQIYNNKEIYIKKFDPDLAEQEFNQSQYVIPNSKKGISDGQLYAYAGYKYLTGTNPILLNAEHMTLGKYFIGVSILLFKNENISGLISVVLTAILFYLILKQVTNSFLLSSIGFFLFTNDSTIKMFLKEPTLLDIYQLLFLLLTFYFYIKWVNKQQIMFNILTGLSLGFLATVKFYLIVVIVAITLLIHMLLSKLKLSKIIFFILISSLSFTLAFLLTYIPSFTQGTTITEFIKAQKWIFNFWRYNHLNYIEAKGNVLPLLLFNKWKIWWDNKGYINFEYWNLIYPFSIISMILLTIIYLNKAIKLKRKVFNKQTRFMFLFLIWIWLYMLYLIKIPIYPRYLILYFPFVYMVLLIYMKNIIGKEKEE